MKHSWKCLLLAGVCALLAPATSAAQTPSASSSSSPMNFFRMPSMGSTAKVSSQRRQRVDVIQARRQQANSQSMFANMGKFIWTFGGLRQVPASPITVPSTRRPF